MAKVAILNIPKDLHGMDLQSNGVHPIVLVNAFTMLQKHYSRVLVEMARQAVGDDDKQQEQWLDRVTKKYLGENPGDLKIDPNLFN